MKTGWIIICPNCGTKLDQFSLADEWFCECGESGSFVPTDDDDQDESEATP